MIDNTVTVVGNLTTDPELRFTSTGTAVANFTVASSPRVFDKDSMMPLGESDQSCSAKVTTLARP
jgi:single-stranded DNA-binding protein